MEGVAVTSGTLRFICTDRGTHPTREIGVLTRFDDDDEMVILSTDRLMYQEGRLGAAGDVVTRATVTTEGRGEALADVLWVFHCPTCRLHIQWRDDRAVRIVDT